MTERVIMVSCTSCGKKNEIPVRVFYDGFEGPICCSGCGEELEIDTDEGE